MRAPSFSNDLNDGDGWRFADVVGIALESQAENTELLPAQGPKRTSDFLQKPPALFDVNVHHLGEQSEVVIALGGDGVKSLHVFWEAGTAVADSGVEKFGANARIGADSGADLLDIRADAFGNVGDGIDEGNFHRQERVGGMLDQFGAAGIGDDQRSLGVRVACKRNCIGLAVIAAGSERAIDFLE